MKAEMAEESSKSDKAKFKIMVKVALDSPQSPFPNHKSWFNFPPSWPAIATIESSATELKVPIKNTKIIPIVIPVPLGRATATIGNAIITAAVMYKAPLILPKIVVFSAR